MFETLKTELQTVDFSAWCTANHSTEDPVFSFNYNVYENNNDYQISIPVYASIYPKTVEQYQTYLYEQQQEDLSKLKDFVKNDMSKLQFTEDYNISLWIHISGETAIEYPYSSPANVNLLSEILEKGLLDHPITDILMSNYMLMFMMMNTRTSTTTTEISMAEISVLQQIQTF